jgi:hypothetical protein
VLFLSEANISDMVIALDTSIRHVNRYK